MKRQLSQPNVKNVNAMAARKARGSKDTENTNNGSNGLNRLKSSLVSQSFMPLYLLLLIRYADFGGVIKYLWQLWRSDDIGAYIASDLQDTEKSLLITCILMVLSILSIVVGMITFVMFENFWKSNTDDLGEKIAIDGYDLDVGITFFVTYILPLMLDDIDTLRGFMVFIVLMALMRILLKRSNLYYQNPVLAVMGYKVFKFRFVENASGISNDRFNDRLFVGLTKGKRIDEGRTVKRRYLEDDVFLLFGKESPQK